MIESRTKLHPALRWVNLLVGLLTISSATSILFAAEENVPDSLRRIESEDPDRHEPIWLAAEEAVQDGYLRWEEFVPGSRRMLDDILRMLRRVTERQELGPSEDGCAAWTFQGNRHESIPNKTLEDLVVHFPAVYSGRVVAGAEGFLDGWPGTLYEVLVENASEPVPETLFVYYPLARIQVEGTAICHQGRRYPEHPETGRQILIFSGETRHDRPLILAPQDEELFYERVDGSLSLPPHYGELIEDVTIRDLWKETLRLEQVISSSTTSWSR